MKKLKQMSGPYSIGFELSSTAHGFVATDPNGNVLYHGKQPVMGTRVFKEGQHAAEARMPRTSRRGIQRRRGREHEMERVFAPVISSIDPDFFIRRRMSYKLGKIRFESDPIGFSYSCLFHSFPTLAHLDVALMESDSAMDPRLIFEAVANHVVRRGHFLLENQNVSSTNSDIDTQVANYAEVLVSYFEDTLDERIELSLEALSVFLLGGANKLRKTLTRLMFLTQDFIQLSFFHSNFTVKSFQLGFCIYVVLQPQPAQDSFAGFFGIEKNLDFTSKGRFHEPLHVGMQRLKLKTCHDTLRRKATVLGNWYPGKVHVRTGAVPVYVG